MTKQEPSVVFGETGETRSYKGLKETSGHANMRKVTKAVIPVAGLGTRMLPATKAIPKELLPVYDPIIEHGSGGSCRA